MTSESNDTVGGVRSGRNAPEVAASAAAAAFEGAPYAIVGVDREGIVRAANRAFATLAGHDHGAAVGRHLADLLGVDGPSARAVLGRAIETGVSGEVAITIRRADGTPLHCAFTARAVPAGAGGGATIALRDLAPEEARIARALHARSLAAVGQLVSGRPTSSTTRSRA